MRPTPVCLAAVCLAAALPLALPAHGQDPEPLAVCLSAAERPVLSPDQRKSRAPELRKQLAEEEKELKALKKAHGKKVETWPEAERAAYIAKEEAARRLESEIGWLQLDEGDIPDSLEDMRSAVRGKGLTQRKKVVNEVATPAEAHLVVEVVGRREMDQGQTWYVVAFKTSLGGKVDPARRGSGYWTKAAWDAPFVLHTFTPEEPYWIVESANVGRWFNAANDAAKAVERFVKDNHDALFGQGPL
jgi:hypothetical protein